uniref:OAS1Aa transcript 2 n=1 Tax=Geodia barretti TaxID=519541 RepID=E9NJC6_GEOBA|nr:OAS1Aa transcript 2 [Geodia barretti]
MSVRPRNDTIYPTGDEGDVPIPTLTGVNRAVHDIVECIEENFPSYIVDERKIGFSVFDIIKAGSLGHGTSVEGNYDLDLVVYSSEISASDVCRSEDHFKPWLKRIHHFLENNLEGFKFEKLKQRSLQFDYHHPSCVIKVDLLVSPHWDSCEDFYQFLKYIPKNKRELFTVCSSRWQVEFMRRQPPAVKNYIRQAKKWRDDAWPEAEGGEGRPSSYLITLLVIMAFNIAKSRRGSFAEELIGLVHREKLNVHWGRRRSKIQDMKCRFYKPSEQIELLPSRPRVVDPANPANNVWISGIAGYKPGERAGNYDGGDGNHQPLLDKIRTITLYFSSLQLK